MIYHSDAFMSSHASRLTRGAAQRYRASGVALKARPAAYTAPTMGFKNPFAALKQGIARAGAGAYDEGAVQEAIDQDIKGNKVMVFSWTRCPFCKKAKSLLTDLVVNPTDYKFVELDEREDGNAIRYELSQMTGRTSVPQIWIDGEFVGGCNDGPGIFTLMDRGELVPKLKTAGCLLK
ncbi:unnamed protein product [Ascophyllum nodosum]